MVCGCWEALRMAVGRRTAECRERVRIVDSFAMRCPGCSLAARGLNNAGPRSAVCLEIVAGNSGDVNASPGKILTLAHSSLNLARHPEHGLFGLGFTRVIAATQPPAVSSKVGSELTVAFNQLSHGVTNLDALVGGVARGASHHTSNHIPLPSAPSVPASHPNNHDVMTCVECALPVHLLPARFSARHGSPNCPEPGDLSHDADNVTAYPTRMLDLFPVVTRYPEA